MESTADLLLNRSSVALATHWATACPDSSTEEATPSVVQQEETALQTNENGWDGLLQSFGLNGFSDIGKNLGYVLAMLPDVLVGLFTGKTKSLNMDNSLLPLAVSEEDSVVVCLDFKPQEVTHKMHSSAMPMADIRVMTIGVYRIRAQYSSFLGRYANALPAN